MTHTQQLRDALAELAMSVKNFLSELAPCISKGEISELYQKYATQIEVSQNKAQSLLSVEAGENCKCAKGNGIDHDESGQAYCIDCQKSVAEPPPVEAEVSAEAISFREYQDIATREVTDYNDFLAVFQNNVLDRYGVAGICERAAELMITDFSSLSKGKTDKI